MNIQRNQHWFLMIVASWFLCKKENPFGYKKMKNLVQMCSETTFGEILMNINWLPGFYERKKCVGGKYLPKKRNNIKTLNIIFIDQ